MKLNIDFSQLETNVMEPFIGMQFNLSINQLYNFATYMDLLRKYKNPKKIINSNDTIIQAINYDMDDINNYWIVLDKNFIFMDIGVPHKLSTSDDNLYYNMSEDETNIIKSIREFL